MPKLVSERKFRLAFTSDDEVRYRGKYRKIVVEVDRGGTTATVRLEGTRQRYPFSFGGLFNFAVQNHVARERQEKKARRKR